jgi:hypothetical protein
MKQIREALMKPGSGQHPTGPRRRQLTPAGTVVASALALLAIAAPAQASAGEALQIKSGKLIGLGTEVQVRISYQCQVGQQAGVGIFLNQTDRHDAVSGGAGSGQRPCTGGTQELTLIIPAGSDRFHPGCASATVSLFTSGPGTPDKIEQLADELHLDRW